MKQYVKIKPHRWWSFKDRKNARLLSLIYNWFLDKPDVRNLMIKRIINGEEITIEDIKEII